MDELLNDDDHEAIIRALANDVGLSSYELGAYRQAIGEHHSSGPGVAVGCRQAGTVASRALPDVWIALHRTWTRTLMQKKFECKS